MAEYNVEDFSGGETDKFRNNNDPRFYREAKNMYITEQRTLETRPGYAPVFDSQAPYGPQFVQKIWHHVTRNQNSGDNFVVRYQTFVSSNSSVLVASSFNDVPAQVQTTESNNKLPFIMTSQGNYIRINDNEFVVVPDGFTRHAQKFYRGGVGGTQWKYVALGLPKYNQTLNAVTDNNGTSAFVYAIVVKHTYQLYEPGAGFITKVVRGAPTFSDQVVNATALVGNPVTIDIPAFNASATSDWINNDNRVVTSEDFAWSEPDTPTSGVTIELYRTTSNGTIFYKLTQFDGGVAIPGYPDITADSTLVNNEQLYTTGGVVPNEMSNDRILFGTWANDALWLFSSSRGWQSKVGIYDAVPGSYVFSVREGERITGCNTIDVYPIVGTRQGIYRIEGIVDDLGRGTHRVRTISEEHGCLSNKLMVRAKNTILFWSDDGIYETNGGQAVKVSHHYDTRYRNIVDKNFDTSGTGFLVDMVYLADGAYDNVNERVLWIHPDPDEAGTTNFYNTRYICMHLRYKHEEGYAITSGELSHEAISISAADGKFFITAADGSVLQEDIDRYNDSQIGGPHTRFTWSYVTCTLSFGTRRIAKWFTRLFFTFKGRGTTVTARVLEDTNESGAKRDLNSIDETSTTWLQKTLKRWFKRGRIRGIYKEVTLTNEGSTLTADEKVELLDFTIEYSGPDEGATESDRA